MAKTVIGLVQDRAEARKVIDDLLKSGFRKKDIGVISPQEDFDDMAKAVTKDMAGGAAVGALTGLVLAATTMMIPAFGPLLVGGPAATLVAGAAYGGLAGGIIGTLISKGVPEDQAHAYAEGVRRGGTLITVHAEDDKLAPRAERLLKCQGAVDIEERARQWKSEGWNGRFPQEQVPAQISEEVRAVQVYDFVIDMPERRKAAERHA
jgi:hypothetical protein